MQTRKLRGWGYFLRKKIENSPELAPIKNEYDEALSKAVEALIKIEKYKKIIKNTWLNDPEILEKLKKEHKIEKALKILKRSTKNG